MTRSLLRDEGYEARVENNRGANKKRKRGVYQLPAPPRRTVAVEFPQDLWLGIEAVAAMEDWTLSKTVVEVVRSVLQPKRGRK